jgi:hypothetical protein
MFLCSIRKCFHHRHIYFIHEIEHLSFVLA